MRAPKPRRMSPEAQSWHKKLLNSPKSRTSPRSVGPRHRSNVSKKHSQQSHTYTTSLTKGRGPYDTNDNNNKGVTIIGVDAPIASFLQQLFSTDTNKKVQEDQVDRIMDAGTQSLLRNEEGREKIRDMSFNVDATARVVLEAAEDTLEDSEEEHHAEDKGAAHEAVEEIKKGEKGNPVAERVKEKVVGWGQTS